MRTKAAVVPGFDAEAALDRRTNDYRLAANRSTTEGQVIVPQLPRWLKCIGAVAGAAATCELTALAGPAGWTACATATVGATSVCEG